MISLIQTSHSIFGKSDPNIARILEANVFTPSKKNTEFELDEYLHRTKPTCIVLAAPYREKESHYGLIVDNIALYCQSQKVRYYVVVNMGYLKVQTPNIFPTNAIYYHPQSLEERNFKLARIKSDLLSLGYADIADQFCENVTATYSEPCDHNSYRTLVNRMFAIKDSVRPKKFCKKMQKKDQDHLSYASPL